MKCFNENMEQTLFKSKSRTKDGFSLQYRFEDQNPRGYAAK